MAATKRPRTTATAPEPVSSSDAVDAASSAESPAWTFLSNYGHVIVCIAENPDIRLREIADRVGITERAAYRIVDDLAARGYVRKIPEGRRNRYELDLTKPLRHPVEAPHSVGDLVRAVGALPAH